MKEMSDSKEDERLVYKAYREEQMKFTYFLLAMVGAAIAVAIN